MKQFKKLLATTDLKLQTSHISKIAILVLSIVFGFGLFVVGFDQGHLLSPVFGESAFDEMLIHELTHDMRHAAGFPCH